jgi:hypothetical protein
MSTTRTSAQPLGNSAKKPGTTHTTAQRRGGPRIVPRGERGRAHRLSETRSPRRRPAPNQPSVPMSLVRPANEGSLTCANTRLATTLQPAGVEK